MLDFYIGYYEGIEAISTNLSNLSKVCYVVGNRTIKLIQIQTDIITKEMFESFGFNHLVTAIRNIPQKKMASKNIS